MTPVTADGVRAVGLAPVAVELIIDRALDEDLGPQRLDVTSVATVPAGQVDVGDLVARADGVLAGLPVAAAVFDLASNGTVTFAPKARDGAAVRAGGPLPTPDRPAPALPAAFERVRKAFPDVPVQVEVTTVAEAVEAVGAGATFLLCDNMPPDVLRSVVAAVGGRAELEATGGLTLGVAREYALTGVNYLSVGALTHSAPILDIALDLRPRH